MCCCYSATSESAESPYNRVARVTRVLHTSCLCHQKSYRNVAWRVACHATMPGRPKRWWAPPGCPAWMTKSEVDVLWKPEDDLEGEFDRAVAEQGESATARRKLMNYFIFNSTEIADWQEETDRASWYLRTTGSLTLLLLRSKVETYKSATNEERGSEDWMDRLFAASWPSAVAPQAAQSGSKADDHLSGIDDDSPSVANGDDRGYVLFFPESGVVFSHTHLSAYSCILMHFQHFHCISSDCILHLLHGIAYDCIFTHSCMLHSEVDAFAYLHTHFHGCIWYKVHSCAFKCI